MLALDFLGVPFARARLLLPNARQRKIGCLCVRIGSESYPVTCQKNSVMDSILGSATQVMLDGKYCLHKPLNIKTVFA